MFLTATPHTGYHMIRPCSRLTARPFNSTVLFVHTFSSNQHGDTYVLFCWIEDGLGTLDESSSVVAAHRVRNSV